MLLLPSVNVELPPTRFLRRRNMANSKRFPLSGARFDGQAVELDGVYAMGRWLDVSLATFPDPSSPRQSDGIPRGRPFAEHPTEGVIILVRGLPFDLSDEEVSYLDGATLVSEWLREYALGVSGNLAGREEAGFHGTWKALRLFCCCSGWVGGGGNTHVAREGLHPILCVFVTFGGDV